MSKSLYVSSFDLGGSGGKGFIGRYDGKKLAVKEVYRFPFGPKYAGGRLYWNILQAYQNMEDMLVAAGRETDGNEMYFGITGFGNSFALLDRNGHLFSPSYANESSRMEGVADRVFRSISKKELHYLTGNDIQDYQTLMQLYAYKTNEEEFILRNTGTVMLFPDVLMYWLTGVKQSEWTASSITGLCDVSSKKWNSRLTDIAGINTNQLPQIVQPCTLVGDICRNVTARLGISRVKCVSGPQHDTAAASLTVDSYNNDTLFVVIGTYALTGCESDIPVINDYTLKYSFGNEGNCAGRTKLVLSTRAMWYLEKLRDELTVLSGTKPSFETIMEMARVETPLENTVDFSELEKSAHCSSIMAAVNQYFEEKGKKPLERHSQFTRCIIDSISLSLANSVSRFREITGRNIRKICALGGGARNPLICQSLADLTNCEVIAGPFDASSYGTMVSQLLTIGELKDVDEVHQLIKESVLTDYYYPNES